MIKVEIPEKLFAVKGQPSLYLCSPSSNKRMSIVKDIITNKNSFSLNSEIQEIKRFVIPTFNKEKDKFVSLEMIFTNLLEYTGCYINLIDKDIFEKSIDEEKELFMGDIIPNFDKLHFKHYHMIKILKWYNIFINSQIGKDYISKYKELINKK